MEQTFGRSWIIHSELKNEVWKDLWRAGYQPSGAFEQCNRGAFEQWNRGAILCAIEVQFPCIAQNTKELINHQCTIQLVKDAPILMTKWTLSNSIYIWWLPHCVRRSSKAKQGNGESTFCGRGEVSSRCYRSSYSSFGAYCLASPLNPLAHFTDDTARAQNSKFWICFHLFSQLLSLWYKRSAIDIHW